MSDNSELKQLIERYSSEARIARPSDQVYKEECVYSYDTAESASGLFVCLKTFVSVSRANLPVHFAKSQSHLYLHIRAHRRALLLPATADQTEHDQEPEKKRPTRLGIGIDGGFDLAEKQFYFENAYSLYVYPEDKFLRLDGNTQSCSSLLLTENVRKSIESVQAAESITQKEELASQAAAWDGDQRFASKHSANLTQLPNAAQISPDPNSWKCELCEVRKNLWLNLSDGKILCGRKQLDGSGGNNHAVEHFYKTKYPLSVKLGTITAAGADVYSYDEDDMVEDSNLAVHLAHFGISMSKMQKTEKTMTELEIDLNQKVGEWDRIQESGN
jgi:ubiquitin carboxyl-terminal hydrolase 5/13